MQTVFRRKATTRSPEIEVDPGGRLLIRGASYPQNARAFFAPVVAALEEALAERPGAPFEADVDLAFLDDATEAALAGLFRVLDRAGARRAVAVRWYYAAGDGTLRAAGERLAERFRAANYAVVERPG